MQYWCIVHRSPQAIRCKVELGFVLLLEGLHRLCTMAIIQNQDRNNSLHHIRVLPRGQCSLSSQVLMTDSEAGTPIAEAGTRGNLLALTLNSAKASCGKVNDDGLIEVTQSHPGVLMLLKLSICSAMLGTE